MPTKCKYIVSNENDRDSRIIYITKGNNKNNHNKSENNSNKNIIENFDNNPISNYITNDNLVHTNNDSNTSISNVNNNEHLFSQNTSSGCFWHLPRYRFPILVLYIINLQLRCKCGVKILSMMENGGAKDFIASCIFLGIIAFFIKICM